MRLGDGKARRHRLAGRHGSGHVASQPVGQAAMAWCHGRLPSRGLMAIGQPLAPVAPTSAKAAYRRRPPIPSSVLIGLSRCSHVAPASRLQFLSPPIHSLGSGLCLSAGQPCAGQLVAGSQGNPCDPFVVASECCVRILYTRGKDTKYARSVHLCIV